MDTACARRSLALHRRRRVFAVVRREAFLPCHQHSRARRVRRQRAHLELFDYPMKFVGALSDAFSKMTAIILRNRRLLASISRVELAKRYAGSVLGLAWVVLQPALLLSVYLFVYMVMWPNRDPNFKQWDFVV